MKPADLTEKLKQYPVAFLCGALLIIFAALLLLRGGVSLELEARETELNTRIRTIEQNIKNSVNIEKDRELLSAKVERMKASLFKESETAKNINFFYGLEREAGIVISGVNQMPMPDPIYAEKGPRELKLHSTLVYDISFTGAFSDIMRFFYILDRVDPFMRVADFQVSKDKKAASSSALSARIKLLVLSEPN